jgi:DNA-binding phage protein
MRQTAGCAIGLTEIGMQKDRFHDEAMAEMFTYDPAFAANYLNELLQDGDPSDLMVALRQIAPAQHISCQLFRTLSAIAKPD